MTCTVYFKFLLKDTFKRAFVKYFIYCAQIPHSFTHFGRSFHFVFISAGNTVIGTTVCVYNVFASLWDYLAVEH